MRKLLPIFCFTLIFLSGTCDSATAQNQRINNKNTISWINYFGTFKMHPKIGIHTEIQWRTLDFNKNAQQNLLRVGINYQLNTNIQLRLGYAYAETFAYGDIPINGFGKTFREHRMYEMATITDKVGIVDLSHRFILEQRWVGRYSNAALDTEDEYPLLNRLRYMYRMQMPLKGNTISNRTPYVAMYDEIMIGFGENVKENVFDQNRFGLLLGYKFGPQIRIEAGYISQILQLGREVNNSSVFQYNSGFILNTYFNFDFTTKEIKQ